ncbi:MAG: hypothetical protein LAO77_15495 [Acidobacteriia bacterium]|nr:hypothetical protein [Terriglobia bacterium]
MSSPGLIDYDNNGSVDLVVTTQNGPPLFPRNEINPASRFIGFTLGCSTRTSGLHRSPMAASMRCLSSVPSTRGWEKPLVSL